MTVALGRYRLVERVGRGCLTEAFLAKSFGVEGFEKAVLVKLLNADHADDPERLETFIREARRSMALSHANVVQVVDLGSAELEGRTRHFIVTEAVRGESLAVVLEHARARGAAMPASVAVGIAAEIARALEHAHRRSAEGRVVAHGALSPRQIFVTPEGAIKVADFCIRAPAREPTEADDLAALGDMLSAIAAELGSPIGELQVLADDLRGARPPRATEAHERLLALSYELAPSTGAGFEGWAGSFEEPSTAGLAQAMQEIATAREDPPSAPETLGPAGLASAEPEQVRRPLSMGRFVGRTAELRRLTTLVTEAAQGPPRAARLTGVEGIGKSRLVAELVRRIERAGLPISIVTVTCSRRDRMVPFSAVAPTLRTLLGGAEEGTLDPDRTRTRLRAMGLVGDDVRALLCLLGLGAAEPPLSASLDVAVRAVARALVRAIPADRAHVYVWDDAHLCDSESASAILLAASDPLIHEHACALFLTIARTSVASPGSAAEVIELGPLDDDSVAQIVAGRLGARVLPAELFDVLAGRAMGNPLFVEELVRDLVDGALIEVKGGVARPIAQDLGSAPASLRGLVEGRILGLSEDARSILVALGVLGQPATEAIVLDVARPSAGGGAEAMGALASMGALRAIGDVLESSPLYADAAIALASAEERAAAHGRAAKALAKDLTDASAEMFVRLADHHEASGDSSKTLEALVSAAKAARRDALDTRAARLLVRALGTVSHGHAAVAVDLLEQLHDTVTRTGMKISDLAEAAAVALEVVDAEGASDARVRSRIAAARILAASDAPDEACVLLAQAEAIDGMKSVALRDVRETRLTIAASTGDVRGGLEAVRALEATGELDALPLGSQVAVGLLHVDANQLADARGALRRARAVAADGPGRAGVALLEGEILLAERSAGESVALLDHALEAVLHDSQLDGLRLAARLSVSLGRALLATGETARAYASFVRGAELARTDGDPDVEAMAAAYLAYLRGDRSIDEDEPVRALLDLARRARARGDVRGRIRADLLRVTLGRPNAPAPEAVDLQNDAVQWGLERMAEEARRIAQVG